MIQLNQINFCSKMKNYSTYGFACINVKKDISRRFRVFSKEVAKSHSETLEAMLNFFKWNNLSPNDDLGVKADDTKKRINALIAIIKNIEKNQTLPTKTMMDSLFEEVSNSDGGSGEVEANFSRPEIVSRDSELEHYQGRYEEMRQELSGYKNRVGELFDRLQFVKGAFSKGYFKLEMSEKDLEKFKKSLEDVR